MAKRETVIAKDIATAEKLLRSKKTPASVKEKLKSKIARLKKEARGIPMTAKQLASATLRQRDAIKKLSKKDFNDLARRLSKKKEYSFLKGMSMSDVVADMGRKAKPVGWRFKGRGNYKTPSAAAVRRGRKDGSVYYEARPNRSDVSQAFRLKDGGRLSDNEAYFMAGQIVDALDAKGMCDGKKVECRNIIEKAIKSVDVFPKQVDYFFEDEPIMMAKYGAKMGKGGIISEGDSVTIKDSGMTMKVTGIKKNAKGQVEFSGSEGAFLIGDIKKQMKKGGRQGYNDKMDESLGMRHRGKKSQSMKDRRDEAKGMNKKSSGRAYDSVGTMDDRMMKGGSMDDC